MKKLLLLTLLGCCLSFAVSAQEKLPYNTLPYKTEQDFPKRKTFPPFGSRHYENHPSYSGWMIPWKTGDQWQEGTTSCCNNKDCDIVNAQKDEHDEWYVEYISPHTGHIFKLKVGPMKFVRDNKNPANQRKSPDGNSHACIGEQIINSPYIICFVPGENFY